MPRQKKAKKFVIGVTGIFGSGKSTVSAILKSYGLKIIDADKIARRYLKPGNKLYRKIIAAFGQGIISKERDKGINRRKLGKLVFGNRKLLKKLNSITHPEIIREIKKSIERSKKRPVVLDAPLLLEAGLKKIVDNLIVVIIDQDELMRRLAKKTSLKNQEILKRIKNQFSQNVKSRFADFIIDNSGTIKETKEQVKGVWESLALKVKKNKA